MIKILKRLPVFILLTVAVIQLASHKGKRLSPWKGGGFGVYSDMHPAYNKVRLTVKTDQGSFIFLPNILSSKEFLNSGNYIKSHYVFLEEKTRKFSHKDISETFRFLDRLPLCLKELRLALCDKKKLEVKGVLVNIFQMKIDFDSLKIFYKEVFSYEYLKEGG